MVTLKVKITTFCNLIDENIIYPKPKQQCYFVLGREGGAAGPLHYPKLILLLLLLFTSLLCNNLLFWTSINLFSYSIHSLSLSQINNNKQFQAIKTTLLKRKTPHTPNTKSNQQNQNQYQYKPTRIITTKKKKDRTLTQSDFFISHQTPKASTKTNL